jgi:uncharacterized metal-binding protein YceD (DUF177 family)
MDKNLSPFKLNIFGLSNKVHEFGWKIGGSFFEAFEDSLVEKGSFDVSLTLERSETMMVLGIDMKGVANLICDRSLEEFDLPIHILERVIYKYGEKFEELDDTLFTIPYEADSLDLSRLFYDLIAVQVPIKRLHPRFVDENDDLDDEDVLVYTSSDELEEEEPEEEQGQEDNVDPRWSKLIDLNNKLNNDGAS